MRTFYLHFNRIVVQRGDPKVWSLRLSDRCFHTAEVEVHVPLRTVYRPHLKANPKAFLKGRLTAMVVSKERIVIR